MTDLDDRLIPIVADIIADVGKSVIFTKFTLSEYDPTTGEATEGGPVSYTELVSPPSRVKYEFINGDTVQENDVEIILPSEDLEFTPVIDMAVTIDSDDYKIAKVGPIYSGELVAAYKLLLRL